MEPKNRNLWIGIAVLVVVLCCGAVVVAAIALGWAFFRAERISTDLDVFDFGPNASSRVEQTFSVGEAPYLDLSNFAGTVSVRAGEDNLIRIIATKKAPGSSALDRVNVSMDKEGDRVTVTTTKRNNLSNASVDLDIAAPPGTQLELITGAGTIDVRDITGPIDAQTGAGTIMVAGAASSVQLRTGAGSIQYQGTPAGHCSFDNGAGDIVLRLPTEPDVRVDLSTGLGSIELGYDVDGSVSPREVKGIIGDGSRGSIYAGTGLGLISIRP
ncbi:MAG: DUF4097 family beta strand repeat-containing protein [Anaerolineae bacterium]|jgi:hypothetical protein